MSEHTELALVLKKVGKSCLTCQHQHSWEETESWEMPWIKWTKHTCDARPTITNLKQFPFNNTRCEQHEQKH